MVDDRYSTTKDGDGLYSVEFDHTLDGYPIHIQQLSQTIDMAVARLFANEVYECPWILIGIANSFEQANKIANNFLFEYCALHPTRRIIIERLLG